MTPLLSKGDSRRNQGSKKRLRRALGLLALAMVVAWTGGCASSAGGHGTPAPRAPDPSLASPKPVPDRTVTILVPGVTGTVLRESESGRPVWGKGKNLLVPRDGAYSLALPFSVSAGTESPRLTAGPVLDHVRLLFFRKEVYGKILASLVEAGWRLGDLEHPEAGGTLFAFAYDWRLDNVVTTRLLAKQLQELRRARGGGPLAVNLICQSNGGHICRYFAKYGGASREEAERGAGAPPEGIRIEAVLLVGTANGGSLRILRELDRGRAYLPLIGRSMRPEVLFTFPALYQDLPAYRQDLFVDPRGRDLPLDLYDAASWTDHGWSIFAPDPARRADRRPDLFGDREARVAFLTRTLAEARRFQRLLHQDAPGFRPARYYLLQNAFEPTPDRAVLFPATTQPELRHSLLFTGDRPVDRDQYLSVRTRAPGDGHATLASQEWLSPQEQAALVGEPFYVPGGHFEMILEPAMLRRLVEILTERP